MRLNPTYNFFFLKLIKLQNKKQIREKNDECKSRNGLPLTGYANKDIDIAIKITYLYSIFNFFSM